MPNYAMSSHQGQNLISLEEKKKEGRMGFVSDTKMRVIAVLGLSFGLFLPALTSIASAQTCNLHLAKAEIRATAPNAPVTGGYLHIQNNSKKAQRLVSVQADFAQHTELHEMKHEEGIMKMAPLEKGIEIPAGATVQLKPGGLHIMFMKLTAQLKPTQMRNVKLVFDNCGEMQGRFYGGYKTSIWS
jgi:copper(I)-binding protein